MGDDIWRSEDEYLHYDLLLYTFIGVTFMAEGICEFRVWSKAMLAEEDIDALRPFLRVAYVNAKTFLAKFRKLGGPNWAETIFGSDITMRAFDELYDEWKQRNSDHY